MQHRETVSDLRSRVMADFSQDSSFSSGEFVKNIELCENGNPSEVESEQLKQDKERIYR